MSLVRDKRASGAARLEIEVNMAKGGITDFLGYVATKKGGTDGHAAANYTSTQLSRTETIRYIGFSVA